MSAVLARCRVSSEQLDLLLSFMEEHPEFAAGKQSIYSRFSSSKLWRLLAERLNAAAADSGGARKSPDKWCRYWADIKYKARKKSAAGGALGDLSSAEERLRNILSTGGREFNSGRHCSHSDEERKPSLLDDDMCSEGSTGGGAGGGGAGGDSARVSTEEVLAEAAMRSALAAEKQAEAVTQAVDLLRELLALLRERPAPAPAPAPPGAAPLQPLHAHAHAAHVPHAPHAPHAPPDHALAPMQHHHHRL
ncbi:uncharacterized protein LOC113515871 [Galleria mellonella]|uniref:Regulatory protein zeste n=1 Tax=Galleria mellonella TaxID=7137 RepID=A0A6J1WUA5_GALME|nr:uncharacterized protein LOC113515871 [Galleria mellonella]